MSDNQSNTVPDTDPTELPELAQAMYLDAFNSAWKQYGFNPADESRAKAVAWKEVKQNYHQNEKGDWVAGPSDNQATPKRTLDQRRIM